jgi:sialic acid synthase SpsE
MDEEHRFICDDKEMRGQDLQISVVPKALKIMVAGSAAGELINKEGNPGKMAHA